MKCEGFELRSRGSVNIPSRCSGPTSGEGRGLSPPLHPVPGLPLEQIRTGTVRVRKAMSISPLESGRLGLNPRDAESLTLSGP